MGAGASLSADGHIYKIQDCGCVYACYFENQISQSVQLKKCCYTHLDHLKNQKYDVAVYRRMEKRAIGIHINHLTNTHDIHYDEWITQTEAIQVASKRDIRGMDEVIGNRNILERFGVYPS